ncbi:glycine receptor subunit alpha-2-like isoform X2 [Tachypleus tridentatus]|uniref:glycine receptor subunit alpha-2-like isoform X2 n=1 Tax=Tachypleus tridentatus TaxID=6853 RepID=UPI003FD07B20
MDLKFLFSLNKPTYIRVNVYINSLGSISASNMDYILDIYLRQSWQDHRLNLTSYGIYETVTLNAHDLINRIWKPDLFFRNVKEGFFHMVTVPNMLIKVSPEGDILYSMRLTLRLSCHMTFRHYPLDTQQCYVLVGPYSQTTHQVQISWQEKDPIRIEQPLQLPEFDVSGYSFGSFLRSIDTGNFSFLNITFILRRQNGYHLIQTYLPTFMIVMISWVSFWLNVDAVPARVTLGVTTLLTLTTVAAGVRTQLPPVSYVKAIDVWIGACSVMVFGALLEFTLVNYLSRSKYPPEDILKPVLLYNEIKPKSVYRHANARERDFKERAKNMKTAAFVDRVCRVSFPLTFIIFNAIYWHYYLFAREAQ